MIIFFCIDKVTSSFEETELNNCIKYADKVVLITTDEKIKVLETEKLQVRVISFSDYSTSGYFFKSLRFLPHILGELFASPKYFSHPSLFITQLSTFVRSVYMAEKIRKIAIAENTKNEKAVFYSFWFTQFATALSVFKRSGNNITTISRAHGTDLFEERVPVTKRIAFRKFQLAGMNKVCSVSEKGSSYLKTKYPQFASRILTSRLGTKDGGINPLNNNETFTILSCAKIRNIKRIHLIPLILAQTGFPVKWIHIGNESAGDPTLPIFRKNKEDLCRRENITVEFPGNISNEQVFELYRKNTVHLFISVSETEGLPVSMMEAISFGVPVLATNVGGCSEIVTEQTGILIDRDFDPEEVAKKISDFRHSHKNTVDFRKGVREFWQSNFETNRNFDHFITSCLS